MSTHYLRFIRHGPANRQRARLLETLLAGADASSAVSDWRAEAFRVIAAPMTAMPGVGAAALCADQAPVPAGVALSGSVFVATPVHYVAEMSNVRLPADGILTLRQPEALALAADFNRLWHDAGIRLIAGSRADLFCAVDQTITAATRDPEDVLGRYIENFLPIGAAAPRLRRLMSEMEMWLFEHAVNRARIANEAAVVNGLWLWGGGAALTSLPQVVGWTAGNDVFFNAFAVPSGLPQGAACGVAVIAAEPGTDQWRDAESRWLERSLADLATGRIKRLELSAGDRRFSISARWRRRFWRRRQPWWEFFG